MVQKPVEEANQVKLRDDHIRVLSPPTCGCTVPPFLEERVAIAITERSGAHIPDRRLLHVLWVPLPHPESEVHVTVFFFRACRTR